MKRYPSLSNTIPKGRVSTTVPFKSFPATVVAFSWLDHCNNQRHKHRNQSLQRFPEDYSTFHSSIPDNPFPRQCSSHSTQREEVFSPLNVESTVYSRDCRCDRQTFLNIVLNKVTSVTTVKFHSISISPLDCLDFHYQRRSVHRLWQT